MMSTRTHLIVCSVLMDVNYVQVQVMINIVPNAKYQQQELAITRKSIQIPVQQIVYLVSMKS